MRRAIASIATVLVLALAVGSTSGCDSASGAQAPQANGIGPITFAIGSDDIEWLSPVIDGWNQAHPGQKVSVLLLPEASNVQLDQLVANLQAKSPIYDVIDMDVVWTAEFASNGWIIPLSTKQFPLGGFLKPAVKTATYQGKLWAVPDYSNADLLFYRKDILAAAHLQPPRTWAQLEQMAETVAPKYHLLGYAGTFAQYEGLTVNFAEAVQSAGGSILSPSGTRVTLNTPQAMKGLEFLVNGFNQGWIPAQTYGFEEVGAQNAFKDGQYLFLNDWPDVWATLGPDPSKKYGIVALPGQSAGGGSSSLGGANLAVSAYSLHQRTALQFIQYLTQPAQQRTMLEIGSFPPALAQLYTDKTLIAQFPYLPTLYQAINNAQPRPAIPDYDQASLVISSEVYQALNRTQTPRAALRAMQAQLTEILHDG
ncbi:MAG TPA: ABC transporter substrate-binding protein [Streptosporangiaceae bacterium]|jgi:multiple sugar transport system substrate-binding protein